MTKRQNFTKTVKNERLEFAGYRCEGILPETGARCNIDIKLKPYEVDHNIPDRVGGKATFENARILCKLCHDLKYPLDRKVIDKVKRVEANHRGTATAPVQKIKSAPFPISEKTANRVPKLELPPRRSFYVPDEATNG